MKTPRRLKGRFNIPLPIISGFIDTFKSKIDESPSIDFIPNSEADLRVAKKVEQVWLQEKTDDRGGFNDVDDSVKHLAVMSGRGCYSYFAESDPKYKSNFGFVDYYDHIFEPQGGGDLDDHLFCGRHNIFKTKEEIEAGMKSGLYNKRAGSNIIAAMAENKFKEQETEMYEKNNRLRAIGLSPTTNNYVGVDIVGLTEMYLNYRGERWYIFFDKQTMNVLRAEPLKEVFESDLYPLVSFATHKDPNNYMSKAPCDDIYAAAEGQTEIFNQGMDNLQKRNWGMRGVDTSVVKNVNQLKWRPDGIIEFDGQKGDIRKALVEIQTPENTAQVTNLIGFLDNFMGTKTGITAGIQGQSDKDKKVGVFFGELEQAADRINAVSKQYRRAHAKLAKRFVAGLNEHLTEDYAIKLIGSNGVEWTELKRKEMTALDISSSGGSEEAQANEVKRQKRGNALATLTANPDLGGLLNKKWVVEQLLEAGEFEDEDIRMAMDTQNDGDAEIMSEAAQSIEDILLNKEPNLNRGATTGFVRNIIEFSRKEDIKPEKVD